MRLVLPLDSRDLGLLLLSLDSDLEYLFLSSRVFLSSKSRCLSFFSPEDRDLRLLLLSLDVDLDVFYLGLALFLSVRDLSLSMDFDLFLYLDEEDSAYLSFLSFLSILSRSSG